MTIHSNSQAQFNRFCRVVTHPLFFLVWFLLALLSFFFVDKPVAYFFHGINHNPIIYSLATFFTFFGYGGPWLAVIVILFLAFKCVIKNNKYSNQLLFLLIVVLSAGVICDVLKITLGRARPVELFTLSKYGFYFFQHHANMWSFPSGHATVISSMMFGLSLLSPKHWRLFMMLLVLTCLSRVVLTMHFVSDVMAGAYLGAISSIIIHQLFCRVGFLSETKKWAMVANDSN